MRKLEHEVCLVARGLAYPLHVLAQRFCIDVLSSLDGTPKLTEDPPFGGLWCDQPALFLPEKS
jgi:hypothetical protein